MADAGGGVAPRGWSLPGTGGHATAMPSEIALGATWSLDVVHQFAGVVADEVRETGQNVLLAPDTDIARVPWGGRISESQGEDPFLNGDQNSAYSSTVQSRNVIATLKHYTGHNQETNRNSGQNAIIVRADVARGVFAGVRDGRRTGWSWRSDVLLQQDQRRVFVRQRGDPAHSTQGPDRLQRLRDERLWRTARHAEGA